MTPDPRERILAHIRTCLNYYCDQRFDEECSQRDEALRFIDTLAAPPVATDGWQPISTAPKDRNWILVASPHAGVSMARWNEPDQCWDRYGIGQFGGHPAYATKPAYDDHPTHWRPLPAPPADAPQEKV